MQFDRIVEPMALTKGFEPDEHLQKHITDVTRRALMRMEQRGTVRRELEGPDTWWELAG